MDTILTAVLAAIFAGAAAGVVGFYLRGMLTAGATRASQDAAEQQVRRAEARSKEILLEAKEEALRIKSSSEDDLRKQRLELQRLETRVETREENLTRRSEVLNKQEAENRQFQGKIEAERNELKELREQEHQRLEKISGLSLADARQLLLDRAQEDVQFELARRYRDAESVAREQAESRARDVIAGAIQRLASDVVSESTVATIPLPNDEMKGRLIGREGRNIRAIEAATGVDLLIDDVPEAVTISCFDPIRRQVAKLAIERLIQDGRIHPARIEESVEKAQHEVDETIRKAGQQAQFDASIKVLHPELLKLMGRLKYRTSYGENVLTHCVEVSLLAAMMADEIGANSANCRLAGFLHDVGKAVTHEVEGPHAEIGADIVSKYGLGIEIQTPIREHHDREMTRTESFIVAAADAISAARPGARHDTVENYIQRLQELEEVARGFEGVERCFAIQAGREIRVLVQPDKVDDARSAVLARDIVKRIEDTLNYPGQIKVVVVRESRVVEYAR